MSRIDKYYARIFDWVENKAPEYSGANNGIDAYDFLSSDFCLDSKIISLSRYKSWKEEKKFRDIELISKDADLSFVKNTRSQRGIEFWTREDILFGANRLKAMPTKENPKIRNYALKKFRRVRDQVIFTEFHFLNSLAYLSNKNYRTYGIDEIAVNINHVIYYNQDSKENTLLPRKGICNLLNAEFGNFGVRVGISQKNPPQYCIKDIFKFNDSLEDIACEYTMRAMTNYLFVTPRIFI